MFNPIQETNNWIFRFWNFVITWRKHRNTIKSLNQLTDAQLRDIGLERHGLDGLIWHPEDLKSRGTK